jgi:hypothetical protein
MGYQNLVYDWKAESPPWIIWIFIWRCGALALRLSFMTGVAILGQIPFIGQDIINFLKSRRRTEGMEGLTPILNHKTIQTLWRIHVTEIYRRSAIVGKVAPNLKLIDVETKQLMKLLDFQKPGRPLIVNFGSCT